MKMLFAITYTAINANADGASRRTGVTLTAAPHCPKPPGRKRRF
jgi:hypothetical protein